MANASRTIQITQWAANAASATFWRMGVYFRGLDILMPKLFLHCADIRSRFEQMRGEQMPQGMAGYLFFDATGPGSSLQYPIDIGFIT
jgi:hypothetical protein